VKRARRMPGDRGQALVEFAIVAPIFFLLVFGVIQVGLLLGSQAGLVDGVRESTRRASTYRINSSSFDATTFASICDAVETDLATRLKTAVIGFSSTKYSRTVSYEWKQDPDTSKYFLVAHIIATYKHPLFVPLVSNILDRFDSNPGDGAYTLTASEQMRVENPILDAPSSTSTQTCAT
jgi:Flp pilus assembly protein TadG